MARRGGVAIASYTSPNICVARGSMSGGSTSVAMGMGLSGTKLRPTTMALRGAVCARRNRGINARDQSFSLDPRKARACLSAFGLGGPRL